MTKAAEIVADYLRLQRTGQDVPLREYADAWNRAAEMDQQEAA